MHDFELSLFQCTFLERKHNASDKQYLDKYHWLDVVLDPHIVQLPKPVKGFIKSIVPLSENTMTSYHASQLVQSATDSNMTKGKLLKLVETKFDGTVHIHCFVGINFFICSFKSIYSFIAYTISKLSSDDQTVSVGIDGKITLFQNSYV